MKNSKWFQDAMKQAERDISKRLGERLREMFNKERKQRISLKPTEPIMLHGFFDTALPKADAVNHPSHYGGKDNVYEVIKIIEHFKLGFNLGNTIKYILRAGVKDKTKLIEDLEKARFYLDRDIENLKKTRTMRMTSPGTFEEVQR